jgi:dihydroorotate dehydrogenase electron transfer subunit
MKEVEYEILHNQPLTADVFNLTLRGDTSDITAPGQFLNLKIPGLYLRRPISVCDWDEGRAALICRAVGAGTAKLQAMKAGEKISALSGLGNGYDMARSGDRPLLIGGGAGVPPLYGLCARLVEQGKKPTVILGFNTASEKFLQAEFEDLGVRTIVTTADGSFGVKGFVTDAMKELDFTFFYACGPTPMFRAILRATEKPGQLSLEARMGCGFGACMGCSIETADGPKRICRDGPVFDREVLKW